MTAAAGAVVTIVGKQHLAHTKIVVELDHVDISIQGFHALDIEGYGQTAIRSSLQNIGRVPGQQIVIGSGHDPAADMGQCVDGIGPGSYVVARIDGDKAGTTGAPVIQLGQVDIGATLESRMVVPNQCLVINKAGWMVDGVSHGHFSE